MFFSNILADYAKLSCVVLLHRTFSGREWGGRGGGGGEEEAKQLAIK
jgi:hypothetical protein